MLKLTFESLFGTNISSQLVERCTGIAEVMGSNPVQAWIYLFSSVPNCEACLHIRNT